MWLCPTGGATVVCLAAGNYSEVKSTAGDDGKPPDIIRHHDAGSAAGTFRRLAIYRAAP